MDKKIKVSNGNARWIGAWRTRIEKNKPAEGDYNFILLKNKGDVVYEPPANGAKPSVFVNGEWEVLVED
jgi:hypothetical protein